MSRAELGVACMSTVRVGVLEVCVVRVMQVNEWLDAIRGCFAHKKQPPLLGTQNDPMYSPNVGSQEVCVSYEQVTPVHVGSALKQPLSPCVQGYHAHKETPCPRILQ